VANFKDLEAILINLEGFESRIREAKAGLSYELERNRISV
jgi:hypothetical protein